MSLLVNRDVGEGGKYRKLEMNVTKCGMVYRQEAWNIFRKHPGPHFDYNIGFQKRVVNDELEIKIGTRFQGTLNARHCSLFGWQLH